VCLLTRAELHILPVTKHILIAHRDVIVLTRIRRFQTQLFPCRSRRRLRRQRPYAPPIGFPPIIDRTDRRLRQYPRFVRFGTARWRALRRRRRVVVFPNYFDHLAQRRARVLTERIERRVEDGRPGRVVDSHQCRCTSTTMICRGDNGTSRRRHRGRDGSLVT